MYYSINDVIIFNCLRLGFIILTLLTIALTPVLAQDPLFEQALQLKQAGSGEAALTAFRQAAAQKDSLLSDYSQFEVALFYYNKGDHRSAIPEFSRLINEHQESILLPKANLLLGKSYRQLKDYPRAIKTFRLLAENFPTAEQAAEARYLVAKSFEDRKNWEAAYQAYGEVDLYHPLSLFGKKSRLAIAALKKKHRKKLPVFVASADALFKKGMAYFEEDDFEMAANIFNRLARNYPKSKHIGEAWLMLGRAEMQSNQSSAIADLQRAAKGPSNLAGRANYYLGLTYGRRGEYEEAIVSLKKVSEKFPDSGLADEAAYWAAYYLEVSGNIADALVEYYNLINKYPYSSSVPAAIWRIGKVYYWNSEWNKAATYQHKAQHYPPTEDTPRSYYFEAKALERLGNRAGALEIYEKLAKRFDHTYYAYRAKQKLEGEKLFTAEQDPFNEEEFNEALYNINSKNPSELAAVMEIWEQTRIDSLEPESSQEAQAHLAKYKELMGLSLAGYAADEARYLVNFTSDVEKESAQERLGEMLVNSGEYSRPIRFADRRLRPAIIAGNAGAFSRKIWQLSYPKGYWTHVSKKAGRFGLDPYLVLAVIREESRFNPRARSRSSARGLMQIMPRTGRGIAKDLDISRYRTSKLYDPGLNIEMGVYFLSSLVHNFGNNFYLALAGYNGGPNRIKRYVNNWYNGKLELVDIDEFIESIPIRETRLYVQKVMGSYFEYKRLYDRKRG